jgi:hypothetical protein
MKKIIGPILYCVLFINYAYGDSTDRPSRALRDEKFSIPGDSDCLDPLHEAQDNYELRGLLK